METFNLQDIAILYCPSQGVFHTETLKEWIHRNTRTFLMSRNANDYIPLGFVKTEEEAAIAIDNLKDVWGECNNKPRYKTTIETWLEKQVNS